MCTIVGGTGFTVLGSGSVQDPYRLLSTGIGGLINVENTDSVTWRRSGLGLPSDPLILTADAQIRLLTQMQDSRATGPPVAGQTIVARGDGTWTFGEIPVAPAGSVTTGPGITGTGAVEAPLALNVSGLVGAGQLELMNPSTDLADAISYVYGGKLYVEPRRKLFRVTVFESTTLITWPVPTPKPKALRIRLVGGGGAGGIVVPDPAATGKWSAAGGGGGGGHYREVFLEQRDLPAVLQVQAGKGGSWQLESGGIWKHVPSTSSQVSWLLPDGRTASVGASYGTAGAFTRVSATASGGVASGGSGGYANVSPTTPGQMPGGNGQPGLVIRGSANGGSGGASYVSGSAAAARTAGSTSAEGRPGLYPGGGGSGAWSNAASPLPTKVGGQGAQGVVIIEELY